ncbi:MAG: DUF1566 domain-containing protein [Epsilonproteobacteria bacterium]|nr:DUF1566 domain-containing protein [Campylobacterota bacterium]
MFYQILTCQYSKVSKSFFIKLFLFSTLLLLTFSGCNNDSGGGEDDNQTSQSSPTPPPSEDPTNQPPQAVANVTQTSGYEGVVIEFNSKGSEDPDGEIVSYHWYENGSTVSQVPYFQRKYDKAGTYKVKLTVTDNDGASATSNELTITIKAPTPAPAPTPVAVFNIGKYATGQKTQYYANDDGDLQRGLARAYTRDNAKEVVSDTVTHLMWQDNADAKTVRKPWADAKTYCANLTLGGYSDWRLPNIEELVSIVDRKHKRPAMDPTFQNVKDYFVLTWSSTPLAMDSFNALAVDFEDGKDTLYNRADPKFVRCVRDN